MDTVKAMDFAMGCVPSPADERDYKYSELMTVAAPVALPKSFQLKDVPIRAQGNAGCCVGFGSTRMKNIQELENRQSILFNTSPAFLYVHAKKIDNMKEEGTTLRAALKVLLDTGVCLEHNYPYDDKEIISNPKTTFTKDVYDEAAKFKIGSYYQINTIDEVKHALIDNNSPVLIGTIVTDSFVQHDKGYINIPDGRIHGRHCTTIDGYDDNLEHTFPDGTKRKGFFRCGNSWSEKWGDQGHFWLAYDFISQDPWADFWIEMWVAKDILIADAPAKKIVMHLGSLDATIDSMPCKLDQAPVVQDGTTLVPLRFIADTLGYKTEWVAATKNVIISNGVNSLTLKLGSNVATFNGKQVYLKTPPVLSSTNRIIVPIRFVSETFGYSVKWEPTTKEIQIYK